MNATTKAGAAAVRGKGRGLVAVAAIDAGESIETCPTIPLSAADCELLERTAVGDYYFAHPEDDALGMLPLGLVTICNHADAPNAETRWRNLDGIGWVVELVALRPIGAGEEITRRYACLPWFSLAS